MLRSILGLFALIVAMAVVMMAAITIWLWPTYDYAPAQALPFSVERFSDQPLIHTGMGKRLSEQARLEGFENINGPSLIKVPDWVENRLGSYYLYFAHHKGQYIRMAYADRVTGPWAIHEPGALTLAQSGFPVETPEKSDPKESIESLFNAFSVKIVRDYLLLTYRASVTDEKTRKDRGINAGKYRKQHIASPDLVVDEANKLFVMYYHGMAQDGVQRSRMATSKDGIHFNALDSVLPSTYLRSFAYAGKYYLLGMPGVIFKGDSLTGPFKPRDLGLFEHNMRHAGVQLVGDRLYVFWSRVGDSPERILFSSVDLTPEDWNDWIATEAVDVLASETPWEGSDIAVLSSLRGEMPLATHELRDPYVFTDTDGQTYLLYSGSGEQALGMVKLN